MNEIMEYLVSLFSNLLKRNDDLFTNLRKKKRKKKKIERGD